MQQFWAGSAQSTCQQYHLQNIIVIVGTEEDRAEEDGLACVPSLRPESPTARLSLNGGQYK